MYTTVEMNVMNQVHPDARVGNNVKIGAFTCIYENVEIGDNCEIGNNVTISRAPASATA